MTTRQYSSRSQQSTLTAAITSGATSMTVVSGTGILGGVTIPSGRTFTLVLDPDTALEEIVDATAVSTNTFTITRAIDGSSAQDHSAGAVVRHMAIGRDFRDANLHAEASAYYNDGSGTGHTMHGIGSGEGDVVGTAKTQTLTNKTLTAPTISDPVITGVIGGAGITFEGSTADAHETTLTVADPTQDNTITLPNTTGTVVIDSATQTLTNKTLTSPTISGSPVITGLSSAGMISSSATPKDYVDSILGSATSAATSAASAATSAASAATSASSASTSASSALTSANSASTSATAAATSATSAAASATAAATSATSASNSASAASTSATSADTSASSASTSASSALTSANSASTSASSALTSANSAATSASSAATSYDSFDDRYLGAKASPPSVDNDGNALLTGALYWNTTTNQMFVWSGSAWSEISSTAALYRYRYTAAGGETSLSGPDDNGVTLSYLVGKEQVYLNGAMLVRTQDYTASTGSSITALSALSASDVVEIITFSAFNVATTISNTIFDAKGDLLTASAADTPAILATGSNDQVLVVDTATTSGLAWKSVATPYAAGKNRIINGNMVIDQRNTATTPISINATVVIGTIDRWAGVGVATDGVYTMGQDSSAPSGFSKSLKVTVTTADTSITGSQNYQVRQSIEGYNVIDFDFGTANAKTVTLSFWVRSSLTGTFGGSIRNNDANRSYPFSYSISAADTWEKKTITITGDTTGTWNKTTESGFGLVFSMGAGPDRLGTAGAWVAANNTGVTGQVQLISTLNATWYLTGVQVEIGNVATAFQTATGTLAGELSACMRYYERLTADTAYGLFGSALTNNSTTASAFLPYKVTKRTTPTVIDTSAVGGWQLDDGVSGFTATAIVIAAAYNNTQAGAVTVTSSGMTQYRPCVLVAKNTSGAYIGFSAEL